MPVTYARSRNTLHGIFAGFKLRTNSNLMVNSILFIITGFFCSLDGVQWLKPHSIKMPITRDMEEWLYIHVFCDSNSIWQSFYICKTDHILISNLKIEWKVLLNFHPFIHISWNRGVSSSSSVLLLLFWCDVGVAWDFWNKVCPFRRIKIISRFNWIWIIVEWQVIKNGLKVFLVYGRFRYRQNIFDKSIQISSLWKTEHKSYYCIFFHFFVPPSIFHMLKVRRKKISLPIRNGTKEWGKNGK